MNIRTRTLARAVLDLAENGSAEEEEAVVFAAIDYLAAQGLSSEIKMFPRVLAQEWHRRDGSVSARLATPAGDAGAHAGSIGSMLGKILQKRIVLTQESEPTMLGGARLSYGDERFDRSMRCALDRFKEHVKV